MKSIDHMRGIEYEALQEFLTQLLAYLTHVQQAEVPVDFNVEEALDWTSGIKRHLSLDDDLDAMKAILVEKAEQWNFS